MSSTVKSKRFNSNGFTIIELILVISILVIIGLIAIPKYKGYREKAKKQVCKINRLQLERMYEMYLTIEELEHSEDLFTQYLHEYDEKICPDNGDINYVEGKVKCSKHDKNEDTENDEKEDESVPFL